MKCKELTGFYSVTCDNGFTNICLICRNNRSIVGINTLMKSTKQTHFSFDKSATKDLFYTTSQHELRQGTPVLKYPTQDNFLKSICHFGNNKPNYAAIYYGNDVRFTCGTGAICKKMTACHFKTCG